MTEDLSKNKKFLMSAFRGYNRLKSMDNFLEWILAGYDKNGDGTVTMAEFTAVMKKVGRLTDNEIEEMLKKADKDGDG